MHYPLYPLESGLSDGLCYPSFEQPGPVFCDMTPNLVAASSTAPEEVLPVTDINLNLKNNRSAAGPSFSKGG